MTCIVGLMDSGRVYIGGDSAGASNWQLKTRKDAKVFRNGDFLIGAGTSFRMIQLLRYAFVPPPYKKKLPDDPDALDGYHEDISRYMATNFVDGVRECLKNGGFAKKEAEQEEGGVFLAGFQGRLFCIHSDYQVEETFCGYNAIGDGDDIAIGVLYASPVMSAVERVTLALQAAEFHSSSVRGPFTIESI